MDMKQELIKRELKFLKFVQKKKPLVSFVIPTYNNEDIIEECLVRIMSQKVKKEVIVIDNGSTDDTTKIAEKYADVVLVNPVRNMAHQRNYGLGLSSGTYVCFVDSDIQLAFNWTQVMLDALRRHGNSKTAGIGSDIQSVTRNNVTQAQDIAWRLSRPSGVTESQTMTMGNCIFNASILRKFRFSSEFERCAEDGDIYAQMIAKGYHFLHNGSIAVGHHNPTTLTALAKQYYQFGKCNHDYNKKWRSISPLMLLRYIYTPVLIMLYIVGVMINSTSLYLLLWFLLPFIMYTLMLLIKSRKFNLNFSFVNSWKFMWHSLGLMIRMVKKG